MLKKPLMHLWQSKECSIYYVMRILFQKLSSFPFFEKRKKERDLTTQQKIPFPSCLWHLVGNDVFLYTHYSGPRQTKK